MNKCQKKLNCKSKEDIYNWTDFNQYLENNQRLKSHNETNHKRGCIGQIMQLIDHQQSLIHIKSRSLVRNGVFLPTYHCQSHRHISLNNNWLSLKRHYKLLFRNQQIQFYKSLGLKPQPISCFGVQNCSKIKDSSNIHNQYLILLHQMDNTLQL